MSLPLDRGSAGLGVVVAPSSFALDCGGLVTLGVGAVPSWLALDCGGMVGLGVGVVPSWFALELGSVGLGVGVASSSSSSSVVVVFRSEGNRFVWCIIDQFRARGKHGVNFDQRVHHPQKSSALKISCVQWKTHKSVWFPVQVIWRCVYSKEGLRGGFDETPLLQLAVPCIRHEHLTANVVQQALKYAFVITVQLRPSACFFSIHAAFFNKQIAHPSPSRDVRLHKK